MAEESMLRATEQMVMVLGTMKGVAMKLGQMLSVLDLDLVRSCWCCGSLRWARPSLRWSTRSGSVRTRSPPSTS
ncbi:hypothetical protein, partial [Nocardia wallacei]|uniref:hypothetical protein n=1 Tax=Nocardia wallacei TaxID=480035 RepID=UPI002455C47F